jgi:hypothetical protein
MRATILASVCFLALALVACSDDEDDPSPEPTQPAATGSGASPEAELTPTSEEIAWVEEICALDTAYQEGYDALPESSVDPATLTLEQRRARAETFWPGIIDLETAYQTGLEQITPVAGAETLQQHMAGYSEQVSADLQAALVDIDAIFVSAETLDADNRKREQNETVWRQRIDFEFSQQPRLRALYLSLPGCPKDEPTPVPSPQ